MPLFVVTSKTGLALIIADDELNARLDAFDAFYGVELSELVAREIGDDLESSKRIELLSFKDGSVVT